MIRVWLGTLVAMAATPAFADSFSFSYSFAMYEAEVTGTFTGVQNGLFVENISDLTLSIDGNVVPSFLFGARWDDENGGWSSGPVISFNLFENNFMFSDADFVGGDQMFGYFFLMMPNIPGFGTLLETPEVYASDIETPGTWTLTNLSTPTSVPDGGVTAGMLLLALAGLRLLRKTTAA